jgi:hypothetical protein
MARNQKERWDGLPSTVLGFKGVKNGRCWGKKSKNPQILI